MDLARWRSYAGGQAVRSGGDSPEHRTTQGAAARSSVPVGRGRALGLLALGTALALALIPGAAQARGCKQPGAKNEPPCNPYLAQSPWGASHRGSYAQGSSPFRGVESDRVASQHIDLPGIPIQIEFSDRYADGGRVAWGSMVDATDAQNLFKIDVRTGRVIDLYMPKERENPPPPSGQGGITGAYNILDRNGRFFVLRPRWIDVYGDSVKGDPDSPIELRKRYTLPDSFFCGDDDRLVGATMTYGGYVALASERGVVGTIPRQPAQMTDSNLRSINVNEGLCDAPIEDLESVSNSIAADERGGIYVVTSKKMYRFDHDPSKNALTQKWSARYNAGSETSEIRLGAGSGSTPSVMGTGKQDKFVVITDGQDLMHVDLFWRNGIPADWKGLGGDHSRRLACEYPVRFGDPNATTSLSEQSVAVRGYGTFHVNNALNYTFPPGLPAVLVNALAALRGGDPAAAPYGAERIDWNPKTRKCHSVWANSKVSIPNGIPSISQRSGLAYGISQRNGVWGVRGLSWKNGKSKLFAPASDQTCSSATIDLLAMSGILPLLGPTLEELPNSCQDSTYAATEVGPGKAIWTGTFLGATIYRPKGGG